MALNDTGYDKVATLTGMNAKTTDDAGNTVIVSASHEAIQDYGWPRVFEAASRKYDAEDVEPNSSPPLVRVTAGDCSDA